MDKNYDKYVGKNVILTNWDGRTQNVKIIRNNKEKKCLEITDVSKSPGTHFLIYANIGEGCAVTKIDIVERDVKNVRTT